jgi:hypothetical protein
MSLPHFLHQTPPSGSISTCDHAGSSLHPTGMAAVMSKNVVVGTGEQRGELIDLVWERDGAVDGACNLAQKNL